MVFLERGSDVRGKESESELAMEKRREKKKKKKRNILLEGAILEEKVF